MAKPRRNDFLIPTLGVLFDGIAIEASFLVSYYLRFNTQLLNFLPLQEEVAPLDAYIFGSLVVIPIWLLLFNTRNMYGARRNASLTDEFVSIIKLATLGMLVVMSAAFFYRAFSYSRVVFGLLWVSSILFITVGRTLLYKTEKILYMSGRELRNAVIIGSTETANRIFSAFHNHPLLGYRLVGYFSDIKPTGTALANAEYLGTIASVSQQLSEKNIELVLLALNHEEHPKIFKLVQDCEGVNVEFLMAPDILDVMASSLSLKEIEGIPFIQIKGVPMTTWGRILKRIFDIVVSSILSLILSPLFLLIAIIIKLDSKGPVLYAQERIGLDATKFKILKFRSMKTDAETGTGPVWAQENDPRRTHIGTFLRRTSLDEFPQLINVLKGEMSLVGPRPERPYFVEQFKQMIPKYLDRHRVKTGMTGWAQVNGLRGPYGTLEERIKYDIYYIENWTLWFDIKILIKTISAIFSSKSFTEK